jgi:hypothetical protein
LYLAVSYCVYLYIRCSVCAFLFVYELNSFYFLSSSFFVLEIKKEGQPIRYIIYHYKRNIFPYLNQNAIVLSRFLFHRVCRYLFSSIYRLRTHTQGLLFGYFSLQARIIHLSLIYISVKTFTTLFTSYSFFLCNKNAIKEASFMRSLFSILNWGETFKKKLYPLSHRFCFEYKGFRHFRFVSPPLELKNLN